MSKLDYKRTAKPLIGAGPKPERKARVSQELTATLQGIARLPDSAPSARDPATGRILLRPPAPPAPAKKKPGRPATGHDSPTKRAAESRSRALEAGGKRVNLVLEAQAAADLVAIREHGAANLGGNWTEKHAISYALRAQAQRWKGKA